MVEIGGRPILWHIMQHYEHYGFKEFAIALGYKGELIRAYLENLRASSTQQRLPGLDLNAGYSSDWTVHLVDTGVHTKNGGRIKRLAPHLGQGTFMLTWCDGLSDINLHELLAFHRSHGKLATVTAVHPPPRFGHLELNGDQVVRFAEKPVDYERWINGAFFVLEPEVLSHIEGDDTQWEKEPLERLARDGQLMAYRHSSFWQCMDTIHDKERLEALWETDHAPWRSWK